MTGSEPKNPEPEDEPVEELEVPALSALLKRSLTPAEPAPAADAEPAKEQSEQDRALLLGVQRKLRQRSKGKFYADGWSTSHSRVNYALVAGRSEEHTSELQSL